MVGPLLIPHNVVQKAVARTMEDFPEIGENTWRPKHLQYCKRLCGELYEDAMEDPLHRQIKNMSKSSLLTLQRGVESTAKLVWHPRGEYLEYRNSAKFIKAANTCLAAWEFMCVICCDAVCEVEHVRHRTFDSIGDEKLIDIVPVCVKCFRKVAGRMPNGNEYFEGGDYRPVGGSKRSKCKKKNKTPSFFKA